MFIWIEFQKEKPKVHRSWTPFKPESSKTEAIPLQSHTQPCQRFIKSVMVRTTTDGQ